jgi:hypothetical protein
VLPAGAKPILSGSASSVTSLELWVDGSNGTVTITLSSPTPPGTWYGVGFNASEVSLSSCTVPYDTTLYRAPQHQDQYQPPRLYHHHHHHLFLIPFPFASTSTCTSVTTTSSTSTSTSRCTPRHDLHARASALLCPSLLTVAVRVSFFLSDG